MFSGSPPCQGFGFGAGLLRTNSSPSLFSAARRRISLLSLRLARKPPLIPRAVAAAGEGHPVLPAPTGPEFSIGDDGLVSPGTLYEGQHRVCSVDCRENGRNQPEISLRSG